MIYSRNYTESDYADDLVLFAYPTAQIECLLHILDHTAKDIGLYENPEFMCFNWDGIISSLNDKLLKLVDPLIYLGNNISSTTSDVSRYVDNVWTAIDKLPTIWKSDLSDKIKQEFLLAVAMLVLIYSCATWTLVKCLEKKQDGNYTKMLHAIWTNLGSSPLENSHLHPISQTIQVRWIKHAGHY